MSVTDGGRYWGGPIGFRWFWVAESVKVSCQLPLGAQESDWHSNGSSGKQTPSHMLRSTPGSRSNPPRVGGGHASEGCGRWARAGQGERFGMAERLSELRAVSALLFSLGSLTFEKPLESRCVSQSGFFWWNYEAPGVANSSKCDEIAVMLLDFDPNGKSNSFHVWFMQKRILKVLKSVKIIRLHCQQLQKYI